jgi:hypothetical protein
MEFRKYLGAVGIFLSFNGLSSAYIYLFKLCHLAGLCKRKVLALSFLVSIEEVRITARFICLRSEGRSPV